MVIGVVEGFSPTEWTPRTLIEVAGFSCVVIPLVGGLFADPAYKLSW